MSTFLEHRAVEGATDGSEPLMRPTDHVNALSMPVFVDCRTEAQPRGSGLLVPLVRKDRILKLFARAPQHFSSPCWPSLSLESVTYVGHAL